MFILGFAVLKILNGSNKVSSGSSMGNFSQKVNNSIVTYGGPLKPCFFSVEITKHYL